MKKDKKRQKAAPERDTMTLVVLGGGRERFWKTVGCPGRRGSGRPRSPSKTDWGME